MSNLDVVTTNNEVFSEIQSAELARLIYIRWGRDVGAAHSAWKRLHQNDCTLRQFQSLLEKGMTLHVGD